MTETPIRLLIIEDDQVDRMACRRELALQTDVEFRFIEAETGCEGLQLAQRLQPDCILLDYQLPDLSGTEVLAGLVMDDGGLPVPVIMLTGADRASVAVESLRLGAHDYLVKDPERRYLKLLPAVIERALRERRLRAEKREAERELHKRRGEMERLLHLHTASQTAAAIAHELNQPLNAVAAYNEASLRMLRDGGADTGRILHALEQSAEQVQRAGNIIRELLAFLCRGEVCTETLDFNATVRDAVAQCEAADCLNGHPTLLALSANLPPVRANRIQAEKVLLNLLQNAGEAMHEAGWDNATVTVRTLVNAEGLVQATVEDTGPGLAPGMLERVFDPFFTTKPDGLGMGLALSRALIEAQGGRLWAESDAAGTRFSFTLPTCI